MPLPKHIVIVAGEESGDLHAARLVEQLRAASPDVEISGIGGRHMQAAGVNLISDLARFAVTGFVEVIQHLSVIRQAFRAIQEHLRQNKPDLLILVDYPGFNLRLARFAKGQLNIPILYYISPQIWAWKPKRLETIRNYVDHMAVILPFEKKLYQQANMPVSFVGHPLLEKVPQQYDAAALRKKLALPDDKKIIAVLPGSRRNEIKFHMPVLQQSINQLNKKRTDLHFVIPMAGSLDPELIPSCFSHVPENVTFLHGQALDVVASSDCVVVASGTASLECALLAKPMCIFYKSAWLTYYLAMKLVNVKYLGLCNLLADKMLVPELLQYDFNSHELAKMIEKLLEDEFCKNHMRTQLQQLRHSLSQEQADCQLFDIVQQF